MDAKVLDKLELAIATPSFLDLLGRTMVRDQGVAESPKEGSQEPEALVDSYERVEGQDESCANGEAECIEDFTVIDKDDAIDALAHYIAQNICVCPEAQALTPKQLQTALRSTLQSIKKSKFKRMCSLGQYAYRWGAFSYSAIQMWQNPWLVQTVMAVLCTSSKMVMERVL